jgi:hypothetical protein
MWIMQGLQKPIYQMMASGMDVSTAKGLDKCDDACCGFQKDVDGMRVPGPCSVFGDPNFGLIEFDWQGKVMTLRVMNGNGSGVAIGADGAVLQLSVSLDTCMPVT